MSWLSIPSGLIVGALVVILYVGVELLRKRKPLLRDASAIFLGFPGVVLGINIFFRSLDDVNCPVEGESRTYFAFSGMALVWISVESIASGFRKAANP